MEEKAFAREKMIIESQRLSELSKELRDLKKDGKGSFVRSSSFFAF